MKVPLSQAGKEELALALILWKDFKSDGKTDVQIFKQAFEMAKYFEVLPEFENLLSQLPPLKITIRELWR